MRTFTSGLRRDQKGYNHHLVHFLDLLAKPGFRREVEDSRTSVELLREERRQRVESEEAGQAGRKRSAGGPLSHGPPQKRYRKDDNVAQEPEQPQQPVVAEEAASQQE